MADWTELPDTAVGIGGLPSGTTVTALRDNAIAIAEGAPGAPRVQTAALATNEQITTENILGATAGASVGAVGTYALLAFQAIANHNPGTTHAGSALRYAHAAGGATSTPTGTWRLMGQVTNAGTPSNVSVFLRIS